MLVLGNHSKNNKNHNSRDTIRNATQTAQGELRTTTERFPNSSLGPGSPTLLAYLVRLYTLRTVLYCHLVLFCSSFF